MSNEFWSALNKKKREELLGSSDREELKTSDFISSLTPEKQEELLTKGTTSVSTTRKPSFLFSDDIAPVSFDEYKERPKTIETTQAIYDKYGKYYHLPDYDEYSKKGADIENPTFNEAEGLNLFGWRPFSKEVSNIVTYSRDNVAEIAMGELQNASMVGKSKYRHMTDFEVGIYNYLLAKEGEKSAQEYLDDIEETLNARVGGQIAEKIQALDPVSSAIMHGTMSVGAGVDSFGTGVKQLFSEEALPTTATAFTNQALLEDLDGFSRELYLAGNTVGNMAPSIGVGLINPIAGRILQSSSSAGNAYGQALKEGKSTEEAAAYGVMIGGMEYATSKLLSGVSGMTGKLPEKAMSKIATFENGLLRTGAKYGISLASEITEEEVQLWLEPFARTIAFGEDYDAPELEEMAETAIVTAISTGILNSTTDIATGQLTKVNGLTQHEAKVIEAVYERRLAEESEKRTLSNRDKNKLHERVVEEMKRGYISTDEIEGILGGETYKKYKDLADKKNSLESRKKAIEEEIKSLVKTPESQFTIEQRERLNSLREEARGIKETLSTLGVGTAKRNLFNEVKKLTAKDPYLRESYNDLIRQTQDIEIDENKYKGTKFEDAAKKTIANARKAGASNSNRVRDFVEFSAKYSSVSGKVVDFKSDKEIKSILENQLKAEIATLEKSTVEADKEKLAEIQDMLKQVQEGEIRVNGVKTKDGVAININSSNYLNTILGHEVTHFLEGKNAYKPLQEAIFKYAKNKGDYDGRRKVVEALYKNVDGTTVDYELTADLVGDYLFTEYDFIKRLATENRNVFQYVFDQIKYAYKLATAGSKEARELEKVMHQFEKALRESAETSQSVEQKTQLSLSKDDEGVNDAVNEEAYEQFDSGETEKVQYSIRKEAPPKETGIAYKVFYVKDGKLYPPMVANPDGADTPMGVWLNADVGTAAPPSKTGRAQVKAGGKGTQGGSGSLAFRPGWHLGDLPRASQFDRVNPETGKKELFPENFVWAEVEYAKDVDYQEEAMSYGYTENGKFRHAYAGLPKLPENGYYRYRTNPKPDTVPWVITGAMKVNRLLSDAEVNEILEKNGVPAVHRQGGDVGLDKFGFDESGKVKYSISKDSNGNELSLAVQKRFEKSKAVDENGNLKVLYHGTASGEFFTFDKAKGSVEGDFGSGFYFTDNEGDVEANYEGGGPDFENKVARRAEQIEAEEDIDYSEAEARAREELYVGSNKFEVYLNIENPAIVGKTTLLDYDEYASEYDPDDYDSEEDYQGDVEQLITDDIDQIIWDIERNVDIYSTDGIADVLWNAVNEGGIGIEQLKKEINDLYLEDDNGNMVGNEVTRQIIESLGYDGIIDNTVSSKFNMGLSEDTTHYIVFKPNQIKDISNQNPTDNPDIRYSLSKSPLDNETDLVYNVNSDLSKGDGYARTDEFRKLQAESQRMSDEDTKLYHSGSRKIDEGLRANFARVLRGQIHAYRNGLRNDDGILRLSNEGNEFNMCKSVNGSLFHDCFEISQKFLRNGELVDLHEVKTTEDGIGYDDCDNYLSEDGLSGFSITPYGDLISVFNASGKGGFLSAIAPVVRENAKTLDCYNSPNQPLCRMYEKKFGFKTASVMDYNMEYDHDDIAENHNMPKVAFMVNTESDVETKYFSKDEYDEAVAYRDSFVNQTTDNDIAPVQLSLSNKGENRTLGGSYRFDGKDFRVKSRQDIAPVIGTSPTTSTTDKTVGDIAPTEQTLDEKISAKLQNLQTELENNKKLREESNADYDSEIARLQAEYDAKKDKNTKVANDLLRRIEKKKRLKADVDAKYESRINSLGERVQKMQTPQYRRGEQRRAKQEQFANEIRNLIGDTSTWKDKKWGIFYQTNTLHRNLRDVVRDANGNQDIAKADEIYEYLQGSYNHNEALLKQESRNIKQKYADMKINKYESEYIQMLGEFKYNPDTKLTFETVDGYFNKHKDRIDIDKVNKAIEESRKDYDNLIKRVNAVLREQGMKEIGYKEGYYPHFTDKKQGWLAKLFNWKTIDTEIPTDIAGLTEDFEPVRTYQSFDKHRKSDETDYNFLKGFDTYVHGALDWIYHIEDIQKRRAFEHEIRYRHSEQGIRDKIDEIRKKEDLDADEVYKEIDAVYTEARNPLNNFVTDLRNSTNNLAGKKSTADREMEYATNRKIYSTMTNISNRVSGNMVVGSISSALTNFIPITQSWGQVSPVSSLVAMGDTIRNAYRDDGMIKKSDFMTNRLLNEENLNQTGWDKASNVAGGLMNIFDHFTTEVVWRSKYRENMNNGMSEAEAIHDADIFAENVMAGRSRGNMPTIYNSKNPITKMLTAFQLEVANQYGYMFKDLPQDVGKENIGKLTAGYAKMFVGAYLYNALFSALTGRDAAFDPIGILEDLMKDLGFGGDDEEDEADVMGALYGLGENVAQEIPYIGGLLGGGRVPISSAIPYDNPISAISGTVEDIANNNKANLAKEWLKPFYYVGMPFGGGQLKKTIEGWNMFSDEHPVSGSYTTSGNLRFPVEDTPLNRVQATLFGQYANANAREYFDNDYAPLKEKQIQEYIDVDLPIADYWKYREGLSKLQPLEGKESVTLNQKGDYIGGLDLPVSKKNILINNIADDRKTPIDFTGYENYADFEEFDFAQRFPEKYAVLKEQGISVADYKEKYEETAFMYTDDFAWASNNPERYALSKVVTNDVTEYKRYTTDLYNIKADKDENGKSINGSRKEKVLDYINNLDADYEAKIILWKSEYPSDDTYNMDIINYINERGDLTYEERIAIFTELGFTVENGTVYW